MDINAENQLVMKITHYFGFKRLTPSGLLMVCVFRVAPLQLIQTFLASVQLMFPHQEISASRRINLVMLTHTYRATSLTDGAFQILKL
jgi:hypothetical protein